MRLTHSCEEQTVSPNSGLRAAALIPIRLYQRYISPLFGPHCRFYPSCSEYAAQSIQNFGLLKGSYLTVCRCLKCHPLHPGGFDPVPLNAQSDRSNGREGNQA